MSLAGAFPGQSSAAAAAGGESLARASSDVFPPSSVNGWLPLHTPAHLHCNSAQLPQPPFPPHPMPSSPVTVIPSVCTSPPVQAARVASAHGISDFWPGKVTKAGGRQVAGEGGGAGADAPGQVAAGGVAAVVGARCKVATCRCFPPRERVNPLHKTISPAYFCYII